MRKEVLDCIDAMYRCADRCDDATAFYLQQEARRPMNGFTAMSLDCAEALRFAARMLTRQSEMSASLCAACAEICEKSAEAAAALEGKVFQECAAACRNCAIRCRLIGGRMAKLDSEAASAVERMQ